jgi:hypothetical protein
MTYHAPKNGEKKRRADIQISRGTPVRFAYPTVGKSQVHTSPIFSILRISLILILFCLPTTVNVILQQHSPSLVPASETQRNRPKFRYQDFEFLLLFERVGT